MKKYIYTAVLTLSGINVFAQRLVQHHGKMSKIGQENRLDAEILVDTIQARHLDAVSFDTSIPIKLLLPHKQLIK